MQKATKSATKTRAWVGLQKVTGIGGEKCNKNNGLHIRSAQGGVGPRAAWGKPRARLGVPGWRPGGHEQPVGGPRRLWGAPNPCVAGGLQGPTGPMGRAFWQFWGSAVAFCCHCNCRYKTRLKAPSGATGELWGHARPLHPQAGGMPCGARWGHVGAQGRCAYLYIPVRTCIYLFRSHLQRYARYFGNSKSCVNKGLGTIFCRVYIPVIPFGPFSGCCACACPASAPHRPPPLYICIYIYIYKRYR